MTDRLPAPHPLSARATSLALAALVVCLASAPAPAHAGGPVEELLPGLEPVERALLDGEDPLAESLCRTALHAGWVLLGDARRVGGDLRGAALAYRRASSVAASDHGARLRLARALLELGETEEAAATLRALLRSHPDDPEASRLLEGGLPEPTPAVDTSEDARSAWLRSLGDAERLAFVRQVEEHIARGYLQLGLVATRHHPERAAPLFAEAERIFPGIRRTSGDEARGSADAAPSPRPISPSEDELRDWLAQGDDPALWDRLGILLSREGRLPEAADAFRRALEGDPDALEARQHLARLHLLRGETEEAARELRRAAGVGDLDRDLALQLAYLETWAGEYQSAERLLVGLAERHGSVRALLALADLAVRTSDEERGLSLLAEALRLAPSSEEVLAAYARLALATDRPAGAALALEPLVRMQPEVAEYAYLEGQAHLLGEDLEGAAAAFERATALDPARREAWAGLATALGRQGRHAEAEERLRTAAGTDPDDPLLLAARAQAVADQGRSEEAAELAREALLREPELAAAHLVLGRLWLQQGRWREAVEALRHAVEAHPTDLEARRLLEAASARLDEEGRRRGPAATDRPARAEVRGLPVPGGPDGG